MYEIAYTPFAIRTLQRMPRDRADLIRRKIRAVAADPYGELGKNVAKLTGQPGFRLRVGDWRVIYELDDQAHILRVLDVGSRGSIYR